MDGKSYSVLFRFHFRTQHLNEPDDKPFRWLFDSCCIVKLSTIIDIVVVVNVCCSLNFPPCGQNTVYFYTLNLIQSDQGFDQRSRPAKK